MAGKNQKRRNNEFAKELAQRRKANGDFRYVCPPRMSGRKDLQKMASCPGYRKERRETAKH